MTQRFGLEEAAVSLVLSEKSLRARYGMKKVSFVPRWVVAGVSQTKANSSLTWKISLERNLILMREGIILDTS